MKIKVNFMPTKTEKIKIKRAKPFAANNESRKMLEAQSWTVGTVEQTITGRKGFKTFSFKRDLFGFADLFCMSPSKGVMLVQATGGGNMNARKIKIEENPNHAIALATGIRIQVHDWVKRAGQKQRECKVLEITAMKESGIKI